MYTPPKIPGHLATLVAERTNETVKTVTNVVEHVLSYVVEQLLQRSAAGEPVRIPSFGVFVAVMNPGGRRHLNPKTKEVVVSKTTFRVRASRLLFGRKK